MTYRERKERRLEKRQDWAVGRDAKAAAAFKGVHAIADNIPLGQPILVGHHSEKHARRDQDRIHNGMRRGCESQDMAKHHRDVAAGIAHQLETSIYSDDHDAIPALEARIAALEAERDRLKEINAKIRQLERTLDKANKDLTATDLISIGITPREAGNFWPDLYGYRIPPYKFTNLGGNIRRNKERLEILKRKAAAEAEPAPEQSEPPQDQETCTNCQDPENIKNGYVELWDGFCPDCGRLVDPLQGRMEDKDDDSNGPSQQV